MKVEIHVPSRHNHVPTTVECTIAIEKSFEARMAQQAFINQKSKLRSTPCLTIVALRDLRHVSPKKAAPLISESDGQHRKLRLSADLASTLMPGLLNLK
mmetsp:Transcript_11799/g.29820  ORF Transcript_11799/g.29820 Transcript_11799/m.29820 type:complete len:99 (-) Transcript_11799:718-1014(-)